MGTAVAPLLANIYMFVEEQKILDRGEVKPLVYYRYIDDIFAIFHREDVNNYIRFFNAITDNAPSMKFTITESDQSVNFLDLTIHKGDRFREGGRLDVKIFEKELNKYLYIPRISYHPEKLKASFIKTEIIRFIRNSSSEKDFEETRERFVQRLIRRGYLCHWVQRQSPFSLLL